MPRITQKDIARQLNVTRITVSKALRDAPDISIEMKERVKKIAEENGYILDATARNLNLRQTNTIGLVVPDISNSFFSYAINAIIDRASEFGYRCVITTSRENEHIENENIKTLLSMRVDGLLVAISKETNDASIFRTVKNMDVPLVFFDRAIEDIGFSYVLIDNRSAASQLANYLLKNGYKKFAVLTGNSHINIGKEQKISFLQVLEQNRIPIREDWIIEVGFDRRSGYDGFHQLKKTGDLPEVIFAANDRVAQGIYEAIKELKLRIPEDIGIVAYGHKEFARLLSPPLTIASYSPVDLGKRATDCLLDEIKNPGRNAKQILLESMLEINQSTLIKTK